MAVDAESVGQRERDVLRPALRGDGGGGVKRLLGLRLVEQVALEIDDLRRARSARRRPPAAPSSVLAPRKVFMVRSPSGVTRISERAVGAPLVARRRVEGDADGADVVAEDRAELVVGDLADEGARPPNEASPAHGVGGRAAASARRQAPSRRKGARPPAASIRRMGPCAGLVRSRKASSQRPMMSTMALPMPTTSKMWLCHSGLFHSVNISCSGFSALRRRVFGWKRQMSTIRQRGHSGLRALQT